MSEEWVAVATFSQPVEAHLALTKLESEGVLCIVSDEYVVSVNWLLSGAVGGVKVMVPASEAEFARDLLRPQPHLVQVADETHARDSDDEDLVCPQCRSVDAYFHRFHRRVAGLAWLAFGFIVPWLSQRWVCKQCDYQWKERGTTIDE